MTEHRTESAETVAASVYGQRDSNDNRKGIDGSCEVVIPLFRSMEAQLALKHWPTALKLQVANSMMMTWLCYSVLMKFKTRERGNKEAKHFETTTVL